MKNIVEEWNAEDKLKIDEILKEGDKYNFKLQFRYPFLVRKNIITRLDGKIEEFEDNLNLEMMIYND